MNGFQPKTQRDFVSAASGSASGSLAENLRPSWEIRWSIGYGRSIIGDHFVYMDMGQKLGWLEVKTKHRPKFVFPRVFNFGHILSILDEQNTITKLV